MLCRGLHDGAARVHLPSPNVGEHCLSCKYRNDTTDEAEAGRQRARFSASFQRQDQDTVSQSSALRSYEMLFALMNINGRSGMRVSG